MINKGLKPIKTAEKQTIPYKQTIQNLKFKKQVQLDQSLTYCLRQDMVHKYCVILSHYQIL